MKTCGCGNQVANNARFCTKCGHRFTHPFTKFVAVCLALFGLLFVIIMVTVSSDSTGKNAQQAVDQGSISQTQFSDKPATPASKWQYSQTEDKMRNGVTRYATLESDNTVEFDFPYSGGSSASIVLRNGPKYGRDTMLQISKGQFTCGIEYCAISVKVDNRPIQTFSVSEPSDGSATTLFFNDQGQFLRSFRKAKKVMIEAQFYQEGNRQFTFSPTGLEWQ